MNSDPAKNTFSGFTDSETFTPLPDAFFHHLLGAISDVGELKLTLYALWRFEHMEGPIRFLRSEDFSDCLPAPAPALEQAVRRGTLLEARNRREEIRYFLNSPRGRAAAKAFAEGLLELPSGTGAPPPERPNIFKLYEENIGPLTPMIADILKDAEQTYPQEWVGEALGIAVKRNKRNWKYAEAILRRWKEEGHAKEQDRHNAQESRGRDVTRKVEDFLKR